jgi:hypothetical protein
LIHEVVMRAFARSTLCTLAAIVLSGFCAGVGRAALIDLNDLMLPGSADGANITRDTLTGIEWLDVDVSFGRTFGDLTGQDGTNEFGPGGDFEGFRYATLVEFTGQNAGPQLDSLMRSAGLGVPAFSFVAGYGPVRGLIGHVGCFGSCGSYGYAWGAIEEAGAETQVFVEAFTSQGLNWGRSDQRVTLNLFGPNNTLPLQKGNWLVRPVAVPEPCTGVLLGLGLLISRGAIRAGVRGNRA